MSISLLLPMGLIALAGLIVPLLIHLIRQSDHRVVDFPALRWLRESVRPRRRLQFEDLWLLLARLLLVGLAALLVSMPMLNGSWRGARHWVAVVPGVDIQAARQKIDDAKAQWHWLTTGFPAIEDAAVAGSASISSLLRELDAELPNDDTLSVIVPDQVHALDAERISVGRMIDWIVLPSPVQNEVPGKPATHVLALRHQSEKDQGLRYIRAALAAWDDTAHWTIDDQASSAALLPTTDALIWLGASLPDSIQAWIREGGRALLIDDAMEQGEVIWRDAQGAALARDEKLGTGHLIHLRGPLTAAALPAVLDANFPTHLQALLTPALALPSRADAAEIQPRLSTDPLPRFAPTTDLNPWIGLLIGCVFLIERILATRRQRP